MAAASGVHQSTKPAQLQPRMVILSTSTSQLCLCGCLVQTLRCRNRSGVCEPGGAGLSLDTLGPNHHFGPHELARCLEKVRIAAPPWRKSANAGRNIINICNQQSVSVTSGDGRPRVGQGGSWHIKIIKPIKPICPMQGGNIEKLGFSPLYGSTSTPSTTLTVETVQHSSTQLSQLLIPFIRFCDQIESLLPLCLL